MAKLKSTQISGSLTVSENIVAQSVTASLFGTASYAVTASHALVAAMAQGLDLGSEQLTVNGLHVTGSAQIDGDLKVLGDLTYVGVKDLRVKDKNIELNVDESGSAVGSSADGSGITIKNPTGGDIQFFYSESIDSMVLNKSLTFVSGASLEATASEALHAVSASQAVNADTASVAEKVKFQLKLADNGSITGSAYDGSEEVTLGVSSTWLSKQSVAFADSASKVEHKLTVKDEQSKGRISIDSDFDGSSNATISLDLTDIENSIASASATASAELEAFSASVATDFSASNANVTALSQSVSGSIDDLQTQIDAISGEGTGSIETKIQTAIDKLNANVSVDASGTPVSGGVYVLSGVAVNEASGKLTSGSATSVEVEKAGAAVSASTALSASVAVELSASKAAHTELSSSVSTLSASIATEFSASDARITEVSTSLSSSINELSGSVESTYVKKAGDTMTGDLNMGSNSIKFGDMSLVWNAADQALQFVFESE